MEKGNRVEKSHIAQNYQCENLLQNVYDMETNVVWKAKTVIDKQTKAKIEKQCRYSNKGYSKYANLNTL